MIARLIWTIWTPMSSVLKKADKLNLSLSFDIFMSVAGGAFSENHYCDVIMGAMASQITNPTIVYSIVYSGAEQRKHQSSASLAFVRGIHRWPANSPNKWRVTRKMFPFSWRHHALDKINSVMAGLQCTNIYLSNFNTTFTLHCLHRSLKYHILIVMQICGP